jgi:hypothetical protein
LLSATKYADNVSLLVNKELEKGYLFGSFIKLPFDIYIVSPIGIMEGKYYGKKLFIFDLSAPQTNKLHFSINDQCKNVSYNNCSAKSSKLPQILDQHFGDDLHPKHKRV